MKTLTTLILVLFFALSACNIYETNRDNPFDPKGKNSISLFQLLSGGTGTTTGTGAATGTGTGTGTTTGTQSASTTTSVNGKINFVTSYSVSNIIGSDSPLGLSADGNYLYVGTSGWCCGTYVNRVLPDENTLIIRKSLGWSLAQSFSLINNNLYVAVQAYANQTSSNISFFDFSNNANVGSISIFDNSTAASVLTSDMYGLGIWDSSTLLIITRSGTVYFANISNGNVKSKLSNTVGSVGITKVETTLVVGNNTAKKLYMIDSITGSILDSIATNKTPTGLVYHNNILWVLCSDARIYKYTVTP